MIQIAAPSVASATPSAPGQPAGQAAKAPENGGFAQVLAHQDDGAEPASPGSPPPTSSPEPTAPTAETRPDPAPTLPASAAPLPVGGKILPVADPALSLPAEDPAVPATKESPAQAIPSLLAAVRAMAVTASETQPSRPAAPATATAASESEDAAEAETKAAAEPATALPLVTSPVGPIILANLVPAAPAPIPSSPVATSSSPTGGATTAAALPLPAAAVAQPAGSAEPTALPSLPAAIAAQMAGQPIPTPQEAPAQPATPQLAAIDAALPLKVDPAEARPGPIPAFSLEPAAARPMASVQLRPMVASEAQLAAATAPGADLLAQASGSLAPAANGQSVPTVPGMAPITRPHDFAGLVDRLIAARDAAQTGLPQSVHMAINHAEFGPISLNFHHDQAGLAVSVASADPDFARAVQAAIPAPGATPADAGARDARQGSGQQAALTQSFARADSAAGGEAGQRQSRPAAAFAPDGRTPAANPAHRPPLQDDSGLRQRGIFA